MKKSKFSESQIVAILKEGEAGVPVARLDERVRTCARRAQIGKVVAPHRQRHTFASHLVRARVGLVTIRDPLGHRLIASTQIYPHVTAQDLRSVFLAAGRFTLCSLVFRRISMS